MHVDDFIDRPGGDAYARFALHFMRLNAALQIEFRPWTEQYKLFCDYDGKRWRVTGASRLGDVQLVRNFMRDHGYDERVDVEMCSHWGKLP